MEDNGSGGVIGALFGGVFFLIWCAVFAVIIAGMWKVFVKAGKPGWAAIVPIYNIIVLLEICGKPIWWIVLFFVPCLNFIAGILIGISVANSFGKSQGFGIGLGLLPMIFYPLLGFGDAQYQGAKG